VTIFSLLRLVEIRRLQHVHFTDFHLIPFGESTSSSATLVALTEAAEGQSVELFSVPSFQRLYSLEVSPSTLLAASAQPVPINSFPLTLPSFPQGKGLTKSFPFFFALAGPPSNLLFGTFLGRVSHPYSLVDLFETILYFI